MTEAKSRGRWVPLALASLILAACGVVASTWSTFSHTWDEPEHLAAGLQLVDTGHYDYDIQHPPIARVLLAIGPYLAGARSQGLPPPDGKPEGIEILYGEGHYERYLMLARAGTLPFFALLILVTYAWARTLLPVRESFLSSALLAATPTVLGHSGLATLDVAAAATCLLGLYAFQAWLEHGRWRHAAGLGIAAGLALGTKMSAVPYGGIAGVVLLCAHLLDKRHHVEAREPLGRWTRIGGVLLASVLAAEVLSLAYGGRWIYLTDPIHHFNQAIGYLFGYKTGVLREPAYDFFEHVPVPLALQWYLGALQAITVHNDRGHLSYLLGELHSGGWAGFYLLALGVKTQWPLLFGGLSGWSILIVRAWRERRCVPLVIPGMAAGILFFASDYSHINIGVRHVLIVYPLLAIGAGVCAAALWRFAASPGKGGRVLAVLLLAGSLIACGWTLVRTWPDYLAYFNGFAPNPEQVLVDSDLDWGQDFKRLKRRLAELHVPSISLAYLGTADLPRESLPAYRLLNNPEERVTGWVAVSALARAYAPDHYAWLQAYPVRERVGKTIDLYYIPVPDAKSGQP